MQEKGVVMTVSKHLGWWVIRRSAVLLSVCAMSATAEPSPTDLSEFRKQIAPVLSSYCVDCHGEKKQKAKFALHDIDGAISNGKDIVRWEKILEMVSLGEMPPEDEAQPSKLERAKIQTWVGRELRKIGRGQDLGKLALPHQANRIDHEALFSGEHLGPAASPPRLWRKGPQIYDRFARNLRTKVSQPFLGLGGKGIQDYASLFADETTINTMMRNSKLIAEDLMSAKRTHQNRHVNVLFREGAEPDEEAIPVAIGHVFEIIFQRQPSAEGRERYIDGLFAKNRELGGLRLGMRSLIMGMLMSPEFVFRMELGMGEALPDGRRMLSAEEVAYALSFAFFDEPSTHLLGAARAGQLSTRDDASREVTAILAETDTDKRYWNYPMYHQWGNDYYNKRPRVLRFFQEFFGYTGVVDVFKDKERNPEHHALRLRKDADLFVLRILEADTDVLAELLTSNHYVMDYFKDDKLAKLLTGSNAKQLEHYRSKYGDEFAEIAKAGKWPGISSRHVSAYNISAAQADATRRSPGGVLALPPQQRAGMLTHPAWLVAHSGNFDTDPIRRGKWIREHLLAGMVPDVPIGVDARIPEDPERTLRERLEEVVADESCWRCHKSMNPLGLPFESYDDFGRYRKRIIIGDVDAYVKAKRKYDGQKANLQKELALWKSLNAAGRAVKVQEAEAQLAKLAMPSEDDSQYGKKKQNYTNNLGRWTKERARWQAVDDAEQAKRIADLKHRLVELTEPEANAKPVNAHGALRGSGDPALDGPVTDAVDLMHRLAKSERVRQSFVRHAFRFWMGRNETLNDSPTLIAADRAYVENGGSFRALLVSLLSSDSFLTRRAE
ncbi:MAG: hypothetical protein ACI8W8_001047 [Rhodothermales bacterium]